MKGMTSERKQQWGSLAVPSVLAAAHELKAPLALIRQLTYQLDIAGELTKEQQIVRDRLRLTAERTLRLVENITRTHRLEDALFALEPLQTTSVWYGVLEEISPLARQMGQNVQFKPPRKSELVVAHPELLPAVLMGLCDNALSHNPAGTAVKVGSKRSGQAVHFSVRDNGPTISAAMFKTLESRLGHSPQPLGARPNSSGLGLWIAGAFARAMDANIEVTRHRTGGMTFTLTVPVSGQLALL